MRWLIEKIVCSEYFQELLQNMLIENLVESGVYKIDRDESVIVVTSESADYEALSVLSARLTHLLGDGRFVIVSSDKPISLIKVT